MIKQFMRIGHRYDDANRGAKIMQESLLQEWWQELMDKKIRFIPEAKVTFKSYDFKDFPDQEKARKFIRGEYTNEDGDIYWGGNKYEDFEVFYNELSEQKTLDVLTIETED